MRQVQEALSNIGIPVMAGVWRATSPNQNPPAQYAVYSSTTTESSHADDLCTSYRTYVYLNLWSNADPTEMASRIRQAMYRYGFTMLEQSDKGYNQPAYDTATRQHTVQWTWVWYEEVPLASETVEENKEADETEQETFEAISSDASSLDASSSEVS